MFQRFTNPPSPTLCHLWACHHSASELKRPESSKRTWIDQRSVLTLEAASFLTSPQTVGLPVRIRAGRKVCNMERTLARRFEYDGQYTYAARFHSDRTTPKAHQYSQGSGPPAGGLSEVRQPERADYRPLGILSDSVFPLRRLPANVGRTRGITVVIA